MSIELKNISKAKQHAFKGNLKLGVSKLVNFTWGNLSVLDESGKYVAIKPSGVEYDKLSLNKIVVTDLNGKIIDGNYKPSSDLDTHLEIYKNFKKYGVRSICHTHSKYATIYCQANKKISCLGTTHADEFFGDINITRRLNKNEILYSYVKNTGKIIIENFKKNKKNPMESPAILVANHAPFTWGSDYDSAVDNSIKLEIIAELAFKSSLIKKNITMSNVLKKFHYLRKHGKKSSYGQ